MDEKKKKQIDRGITIASILLLCCVLAYFIYTIAVVKKVGTGYYVVIIAFLVLYWILTDVLSVGLTREFDGKTEEQRKAYLTYAGLDALGLAGLGYFIMSVNNSGGMIGALIYVVSIMNKKKYREIFLGINQEEETEENDVIPENPEEGELPEDGISENEEDAGQAETAVQDRTQDDINTEG